MERYIPGFLGLTQCLHPVRLTRIVHFGQLIEREGDVKAACKQLQGRRVANFTFVRISNVILQFEKSIITFLKINLHQIGTSFEFFASHNNVQAIFTFNVATMNCNRVSIPLIRFLNALNTVNWQPFIYSISRILSYLMSSKY